MAYLLTWRFELDNQSYKGMLLHLLNESCWYFVPCGRKSCWQQIWIPQPFFKCYWNVLLVRVGPFCDQHHFSGCDDFYCYSGENFDKDTQLRKFVKRNKIAEMCGCLLCSKTNKLVRIMYCLNNGQMNM